MAKEKTGSLSSRLLKSIKVNNGASFMNEDNCVANMNKDDYVTSNIPMLNTALSGSIDKGLGYGVTVFAGPSKHFKTSYGLELMSAFQHKYPEGIVIYLDSEFGSMDMLDNFKIDRTKVIHVPITNLEELTFNTMSLLQEIGEDDKVFIFVDSIGNLASKKEVEDAQNEKAVADLTRAKVLKSYFRMITPLVKLRKIYTYFIAHTYDTMEMFSKKVVSGGTGIMYSADTCIIVGKSQEKDGTDLAGFTFTLNIEKSRAIKEKSKIPIVATFEKGIQPYSGLADVAHEAGIIEKVKKRSNMLIFKDLEIKEKDSGYDKEFWDRVIAESDLKQVIELKYKL